MTLILRNNITDSSTIFEANTVAIFPLSEKVVINIEQPEEMGHASTCSCHTERMTQLWQSEPKKRVKEESMGGKKIIWFQP